MRGRNRHPGHPRTPAGTRQRRVGGSAGRAGKNAGAKKHTDERDGKSRNLCLEARSTRWLRCLRSSRRAHPKAHEDLRHGRFHEMDFMKWISSNSAVRQDHEGLLWRPSKAGSRITAHKASLGIPRGSRARNPLPIASLSPSFFSRIASALPLTARATRARQPRITSIWADNKFLASYGNIRTCDRSPTRRATPRPPRKGCRQAVFL